MPALARASLVPEVVARLEREFSREVDDVTSVDLGMSPTSTPRPGKGFVPS